MRTFMLLLLTGLLLSACTNSDDAEEKKARKHGYDIDETLKPSGDRMSANEKEARLLLLISQSKQTMDSIDVAYRTIRKESRSNTLSLDEREQVNEALVELSDTKDLIILEMQESVIGELKQKTAALKLMMKEMNARSEQMMNIATTLSKISGVIAKTTNTLADALSFGLVRPRMEAQNTSL